MTKLLSRVPGYGWLGLAVILVAEALLFSGVALVATFFTHIAWTGYILFADGLLKARRGTSLITSRRHEFVFMAIWSIPAWVLFELYNLHLQNWAYVGLPENMAVRLFGYAWAFATITPAILITAELLAAFGVYRRVPVAPWRVDAALQRRWLAVGLSFVVIPLLLPSTVATYLFATVWIGFILVLEPLVYRLGGDSLLRDLERGDAARYYQLFAAGAICGLFWEFWNYWAAAKWVYTVPYPLDFGPKYFEMPLLGFIGFLPFAVECFCLHHIAWTLWQRWRAGGRVVASQAGLPDAGG